MLPHSSSSISTFSSPLKRNNSSTIKKKDTLIDKYKSLSLYDHDKLNHSLIEYVV